MTFSSYRRTFDQIFVVTEPDEEKNTVRNFYYAPASNDSQISMMLTTSSFDLKWCKILDRS